MAIRPPTSERSIAVAKLIEETSSGHYSDQHVGDLDKSHRTDTSYLPSSLTRPPAQHPTHLAHFLPF